MTGIFARLFSSDIQWLRQSREENCVQTVIAMALGVETREVESVARSNGALTVSETLNLLSRIGIVCRPISASLVADFWPAFYKRSGGRRMRGLGFQLPRGQETVGHAYFLYGARMYDPATGEHSRIDQSALRTLDWLAIFPEGALRRNSLRGYLEAVG